MKFRTAIRSNMPSSIKKSTENPFKTVPRSRAREREREMARAAAKLAIKVETDPDEIKTETFPVEVASAALPSAGSAKRIRRCARAKRVKGINPFTGEVKEKVKVCITQVFDCPRRMQQRARELKRRQDRAWKDGTAAERPSDKRAEDEGDYFMSALYCKKEALRDTDDFHSDWYNDWSDSPILLVTHSYLKERAELEARPATKFLKRKHWARARGRFYF